MCFFCSSKAHQSSVSLVEDSKHDSLEDSVNFLNFRRDNFLECESENAIPYESTWHSIKFFSSPLTSSNDSVTASEENKAPVVLRDGALTTIPKDGFYHLTIMLSSSSNQTSKADFSVSLVMEGLRGCLSEQELPLLYVYVLLVLSYAGLVTFFAVVCFRQGYDEILLSVSSLCGLHLISSSFVLASLHSSKICHYVSPTRLFIGDVFDSLSGASARLLLMLLCSGFGEPRARVPLKLAKPSILASMLFFELLTLACIRNFYYKETLLLHAFSFLVFVGDVVVAVSGYGFYCKSVGIIQSSPHHTEGVRLIALGRVLFGLFVITIISTAAFQALSQAGCNTSAWLVSWFSAAGDALLRFAFCVSLVPVYVLKPANNRGAVDFFRSF